MVKTLDDLECMFIIKERDLIFNNQNFPNCIEIDVMKDIV